MSHYALSGHQSSSVLPKALLLLSGSTLAILLTVSLLLALTLSTNAAPLASPALDLNGPGPGLNYTTTFTEDGSAVSITDNPDITAVSVTTHAALDTAGVPTFTLIVTDVPGASLIPLTDTAQVPVTAADAPITGLVAANSSRNLLGEWTFFTATVAADGSVEYTWDFGDGLTATGQTVGHLYTQAGIFTAVVTATHYPSMTDFLTATTRVTIVVPTGGYYVPPNDDHAYRNPALLVTAVRDDTTVDIVDDDADGDADDTYRDIKLNKGESFLVYIQDGAVNDDEGGPQRNQGDYFRLWADKPVIVCNFTNNTYWEHEFIPATTLERSGTDFYFYVDVYGPQIDVIAYTDNTLIKLIDVSDGVHYGTGKASIKDDAQGSVVFTRTLNVGEDLWEVHNWRNDLSRGHTYHLLANKRVAIQYSARLGYDIGNSGRRDGGTYVPAKNGRLTGRTFYFGIPHAHINEDPDGDGISLGAEERELRIVTYGDGADLSIRGWNADTGRWDEVFSGHLGPHGHLELIGEELLTYTQAYGLWQGYYLFEVLATADVSVFETNWFETGIYGTSDIATYVSAETGTHGRRFEAYLGPPSNEPNLQADSGGTKLTHLYIFANEETDVVAYDSDAYGEWIELYNATTETVDLSGWTLTNGSDRSVVLSGTVAPGDYYLLEYHEKATEEEADFVYGGLYPYFKLGNGGDTLTLQDAGGTIHDTFSYSETWGGHGIYAALARIDPTNPADDSTNWADATTWHPNSSSNLGAYWGTPGEQNDVYSEDGSGTPDVVINEILVGRIWHHFTITEPVPRAGGYHDIALTPTEWEAIHNGNRPNTGRTDPEGPYIIVEADKYVSVMNTNWNDNWMAYAVPPAYPDPTVVYLPSHYQRTPGGIVGFTAEVRTERTTLYNPVTTIEIPPEIHYTPGSYITPDQLLATAVVTETHNADGSWTSTWYHGVPMTRGVSYRFTITATVPPTATNGTWIRSVASTTGTDTREPWAGRRYTAQDVANVVVGATDELQEMDLVINEVMVNPTSGEEWIELYNGGSTDIVLTGMVLSATGEIHDTVTFSYTIPQLNGDSLVLHPDSYILIHLTDGTDTQTDLYAGWGTVGALNDTEGRIYLFSSSDFRQDTVVDFVQWGDDGNLTNDDGDNLAAIAEQWADGDYVTSTLPGDTLGRDRYSSDANDADDWENTGGIHSGAPTPGAINWTHAGLNLLKIAKPAMIEAGGTVTYTYQVFNTGEEPLLNVNLSDDKCRPLTFTGGDADGDGELDAGETWNYTCSMRLYEDTTNYATVMAKTKGAGPITVSDSAGATVIIAHPVGGYTEPVNALMSLWPWITPILAIGVGTLIAAARERS